MTDLIIKDAEGEIKKLENQLQQHIFMVEQCKGAIALIQMKIKEEETKTSV